MHPTKNHPSRASGACAGGAAVEVGAHNLAANRRDTRVDPQGILVMACQGIRLTEHMPHDIPADSQGCRLYEPGEQLLDMPRLNGHPGQVGRATSPTALQTTNGRARG